jgi:hypothetical protein
LLKLPVNNTARLFIEYTSGGQDHVCIVRMTDGAHEQEGMDQYATLRPLIAAYLPSTDAVKGARFCERLSTVSFPLAVAPVAGSLGPSFAPDNKPNFVSFTGRSRDGYRVKLTVFSAAVLETERYREVAPTTGPAAALLGYLRNAATNIVTISGQKPIWNNYVNQGVNAYYQRKQRRVG